MFESTKMQTKLRTLVIEPNQNIFFPIGTIDLVTSLYEILNFTDIFGKHKKNPSIRTKTIMIFGKNNMHNQ